MRLFFKTELFLIVCNLCIINCKLIHEFLSVKTKYENSFINSKTNDNINYYEKCSPVHINAIYRHGIRNPGNKDINRINLIFRSITKEARDFDKMSKLNTPFTILTAKHLTVGGEKELKSLAFRERERFPHLFKEPKRMVYISSSLQRAIDSATAYRHGNNDNTSKIHIRDDIMRYYYKCNSIKQRFRLPSDKLSIAKLQFMQFWTKERVNQIASKIRIYLDAPKLKLTEHDLHAIYAYGASEYAIHGRSNWLKLLDAEDISQLEYATDLKIYWKKSYGERINYQQACPLLVEIFDRFDKVIAGSSRLTSVFYFGHHGSLIRLITLLGLFNDTTPLSGLNMESHRNRLFRNSRIGSFSANAAFVLYRCQDEYFLQLRYNEHNVEWPADCGRKDGRCPYSVVKKMYAAYISDCDLESICSRGRDEL